MDDMKFVLATEDGTPLDEASSALQKSIRRGLEKESVYWAMQLESKFFKKVWERLIVIAHEDVGLADPMAILFVDVCKRQYFEIRDAGKWENLPLINAVLYLCRAKKSRLAISLHILTYEQDVKIPVPDWAKDMHTASGRRLGRGMAHFHAEGNHLENRAEIDPYEAEALEIGKNSKLRYWFRTMEDRIKPAKGKKGGDEDFEQEPML